MSPTVLSVAYPFASVDADPVGGAEQVLAHIDRALVAAGWRSLVVACEGSIPAGELIEVPAARGDITPGERARIHAAVRKAIGRAMASHRIDLVHLHGIDFAAYLPPPGPPVLATLHLPIGWYAEADLRPKRPLTWLQPVSERQARSAPPGLNLTAPIENGVDVEAYPAVERKRPFVLSLGRICPEKGFHLALDAARRADVPMKLAGEVFAYEAHQRYFEREIRPRLDAERRWVGPVQGRPKRRLIASARAVLIPSLAPETSSLVAREAAAAGTPVIAFKSGALVDTVEHGRTGFLVDGWEEMAAAIAHVDQIGPQICHETARARFSLSAMTDAYLSLYRELMRPRRAAMPLDVGASLDVELAPSLDALEAMRHDWMALWARASDATPFQAPGCILPWARHYAPDRAAAVLIREAGRLVGLVPVFGWQGALLLAGTGPTDYNDGIFEPGRTDAAGAALSGVCRLADERGCERVELHQLRPQSLLLEAEPPPGWRAELADGDICPVAPVRGESGLGAMPGKWRRKLGYTRRKIDAHGGYAVELATEASVDAFREALERLHAKRWRTLGEPGVLAEDDLMRAFLADALPELQRDGLLRLRALRIDGETAAVLCSLRGHGAAHLYLTGFDPDRMALGPGTLLIAETVAAAAAEGAREIHFLRGQEHYKYHWGAEDRPTYRRILTRL